MPSGFPRTVETERYWPKRKLLCNSGDAFADHELDINLL